MTTPMMKQYHEAKKACDDALLFFRMGDFYELFHDDAKKAAKVLGLTLTSRDKANTVPMAGFPHHQLDSYLAKLIKKGHRVAVCEQVEDPKKAKGLVKREITQLVTPGTILDSDLLDPTQSNYLAAVFPARYLDKKVGDQFGVAWADISTGLFAVTAVSTEGLEGLLQRLNPAEILLPEKVGESLDELLVAFELGARTVRPNWAFGHEACENLLHKQLNVATLDGFAIDGFGPAAVCAAGAVIEYLRETQKSVLEHVDSIRPFHISDYVKIDSATWRSLEINQTLRTGNSDGSLFGVIDRSQTPMGSRLLGQWLTTPLVDIEQVRSRHEAVRELVDNGTLRSQIRECFKGIFDLERLIAKVATGRVSPRDLSGIGQTLGKIPLIKAKLTDRKSKLLNSLEAELDLCAELRAELEQALIEACPPHLRDGNFIRDDYDSRLDELRKLAAGGKQWIANYQQSICDSTGIPSLKVGFTKVFGYYLEVTNTHKDKVPANFIRKQTLKNAERYITPELKEYEEKVLTADEQAATCELEIFDGLREFARSQISRLKTNAAIIATLDTLCGMAQLASEQNYCCPEMVSDSTLNIVAGRHPVLDIMQPLGAFVPNDTNVDEESGFLHLITGPNMAGKSTYIRQVALITLMAQIGSFVPATSAKIGVVDQIFARVGASDELSRGQSTFMVEMTETARILNTATSRSLVILDEIGRGTSTYDGVSLAWAIVEYLHDQIGCRSLFATHYHELTALETDLGGVSNYNVSVREWEEKIVFLHKIVPGSADKSYGIHVARLAGVPSWVNRRAEKILDRLETKNDVDENRKAIKSSGNGSGGIQMTLFEADHPLLERIRTLEPNHLTPIAALEMLQQFKDEISD
ncbi:DNA mismatch repair protein MutS [Mariniblastus fucicola]|nr:DNA mismatch repair protein MutS [Mariniblastus fucicola]